MLGIAIAGGHKMSAEPASDVRGMSQTRAALLGDAAALTTTMANAFRDDPFVSYLIPDRERHIRKLPDMFGLLFTLGRPFGGVDVTDNVEAAAIWRPPNTWHIPLHQYLTNGPRLLGIFGPYAFRALQSMDRLEKRHPREPHWYLQAIGTDPSFQGKGFGGILLRHRLAMIDAAGLPAYLEASKESNVPLYRHFGFAVTGEIKMPDGPTLYAMWRAAQ
jgi:ribosomal protein S18 acetylase RimI-like enzyme